MKVFLLGPTVNSGHEILKRLFRDYHTIKVLVRNPAKLNLEEYIQLPAGQVDLIAEMHLSLTNSKNILKVAI